jgi:hypothetical protein
MTDSPETERSGYSGRSFARKLRLRGRRGFLKLLTTTGVSAAAFSTLTPEALANLTDDPRDEVPLVESYHHTNHEEVQNKESPPEREPIYFTLPAEEWRWIAGAHDAKHGVMAQIESDERVSVGLTTERGRRGRQQTIEVKIRTLVTAADEVVEPDVTKAELRERLPDVATGTVGEGQNRTETDPIPVEIREVTYEEQASNYYNCPYRPVPAGCESLSTTTCPAYDPDDTSDWGVILCGHAPDFETGVDVQQPDGDDYLGTTTRIFGYDGDGEPKDAAFVNSSDGGLDNTYNVAGECPESYDDDIYGTIAEDKLLELESNSDYVKGQGIASGRDDYAPVKSVDDASFRKNATVKIGWDSEGGDSGGPYYWIDSTGTAKMVGVHAWALCGGSCAGGNTMFTVEEGLNVKV